MFELHKMHNYIGNYKQLYKNKRYMFDFYKLGVRVPLPPAARKYKKKCY